MLRRNFEEKAERKEQRFRGGEIQRSREDSIDEVSRFRGGFFIVGILSVVGFRLESVSVGRSDIIISVYV